MTISFYTDWRLRSDKRQRLLRQRDQTETETSPLHSVSVSNLCLCLESLSLSRISVSISVSGSLGGRILGARRRARQLSKYQRLGRMQATAVKEKCTLGPPPLYP